tara:strand:+ start:5065 stop:6321 length:1257 start_codon:yes stop_codon:yes gene_type:complete
VTRRRKLTGYAASIPSTPNQSASADYEWVRDTHTFESLVNEAAKASRIALDTEFHRERTYWPKLALLQLQFGHDIYLVDPLEVNIAPLADALDSNTTFIMHAAAQDLEVLERACGTVPNDLFDTQVAAGFVGMTTPSLSSLVERYTGVRLPKGDRLTDWLERPLKSNQRDYAANDVRYLFEVHDRLLADLKQMNRVDWAIAECERMQERLKPNVAPELAWTRIKEARHLTGKARRVAAHMAEWREVTARARDVPVRFVLSDLALVGIAQRAPRSTSELKSIRGFDGRYLKDINGAEMIALVEEGLSLPSDQVATLEPDDSPQLDKDLRAAVTLVSAWISQVAKDESLDPALLATRSDITDFLRGSPTSRLATGWRSDLVGERIRALVEGRAALAFEKAGLVLEPRGNKGFRNKAHFNL